VTYEGGSDGFDRCGTLDVHKGNSIRLTHLTTGTNGSDSRNLGRKSSDEEGSRRLGVEEHIVDMKIGNFALEVY
jgi:hypothetical protein